MAATGVGKRKARGLLSALVLAVWLAAPAGADTYTVNTLADNTNGGDGGCTLREAILAANNAPANGDCGAGSNEDDTITFDASITGGTITLTVGTLPAIVSGQGSLTIDGTGRNITISGNNLYRVMQVNSGADLTLRNLSVANGLGVAGGFGGGGVVNAGGTLTIIRCTFSGNTAPYGAGGVLNASGGTLSIADSTFSGNNASSDGGGVLNASGGTLSITNSAFSGNSAGNFGGGVLNAGSLTITNSTFSGNTANSSGGGVFNSGVAALTITASTFSDNRAVSGGGAYNVGSLQMTESTLTDNQATLRGGGVYNGGTLSIASSTFSGNNVFSYSGGDGGGGVFNASSGTLTITNSTFSGNIAGSFSGSPSGGGVYNAGTLAVINSTFSGNRAVFGGGVYSAGTLTSTNSTFSSNSADFAGGGVRVAAGTATLKNTIIANSPRGGDCVGTLTGASINNLIEGPDTCNLTDGVNGNIVGHDPDLGTLTGSPAYFPLNPGSPAIDAGDNTTCAAPPVNNQSQNGVSRPQDGDGNGTDICDIGSYELSAAPTHLYVVNTTDDNTTPNDGLCTLREAILAANNDPGYNSNSGCGSASAGDDTITFSVSGTITLTIGGLPPIVSGQGRLTIDGAGQNITVSGNDAVRVMEVQSGARVILKNLTVANGWAGPADGGGVLNHGTLTIINSTFSGNRSSSPSGGGGGVYSTGALTLINSTFSGNNANYAGGGVWNLGTLAITNSTFSGNVATSGGGVYNAFAGTLTISNSTLAENTARGNGGGVYNGGTATVKNTIIANSPNGGNCSGSFAAASTNNMATDTTCGSSFTSVTSTELNLGALTGSPAYFPLNPGSPAIDAGDDATCSALPVSRQSQNGITRPQDGDGNGSAICDIGSYEVPTPAHYVVNTTNDDTTPSDGRCTLREAILAANNDPGYNSNSGCGSASGGDDTITFSVSGTITLTVGTLPAIVSGQGRLTIDGGGNVTIDGNNAFRVMEVNSGADLTLRNLTIERGNASPGGGVLNDGTLTIENSTFRQNAASIFGGGVRNNGALTITNSTFWRNSARYGGGVENYGTMSVTNSTFAGNSASVNGGGVVNGGSLTITASSFSGNSAGDSGGGVSNGGSLTITGSAFSANSASANGGGVVNYASLTISGSSFSGNSASFDGGGVFNGGSLTLVNNTLASNSAGRDGGGVWSGRWNPLGPRPTLEVYNTTFSENQAGGSGGGLRIVEGDATLRNTIVANSPSGGDCVGSLTGSNLNNLIEDTAANACNLIHGSNGNIVGQDPQLLPLFGSPAYFPLQLGSPAIDAGDDATCGAPPVSSQSQNGVTRPQDGDGNGSAICDIGSYEMPTPARYVVNTTDDNTTPNDGLCTLREAILAANNDPGYNSNSGCGSASAVDDTITFDASITGGTITLTMGTLPAIVAGQGRLTIDGAGQNITVSGNNSVGVMEVNPGAELSLRDLTVANGNASSGGGVRNRGTLTITSVTFLNNRAGVGGGGGVRNDATLTITKSSFLGNSAMSGGGVYNAGTVTIANSTFSGNSASAGGGGVYNAAGTLIMINSTLSGNGAGVSGGGVYNFSTATIANTIIANSTGGGDCVGTLTGASINNLIEGPDTCNLTDGVNGNIVGFDPGLGALTGSPAYFPLNPGSRAIDAGDNATCTAPPVNNHSQNGITRPQDGNGDGSAICDIGSYEATAAPTHFYVVNTTNDDTTPNDGLCTLREAILAANNDPGYNSNSGCGSASAVDDTIAFSVSGTITLTVGTLPAIVSGQGTLTIDGGGNVTIDGNNAFRVMEVNSGADLTLRNLTIERGDASPGGGVLNDGTLRIENSTFRQNAASIFGGGVRNNGTLTITNSIFSENSAGAVGGGVENRGTLTITGSTFSGNSADSGGGVVNESGSTLTITNSTFSGNSAGGGGGGVSNRGTLTITGSTFSGNSADSGGGVWNELGSTLTITNSTFSGNSAGFDGGGVRNLSGTLTIANSTFSANSASRDGGGVWSGRFRPSDPFPTLEVYNSTFSENQAGGSGGGLRIVEGDATLRNTIVANSPSGGDCVGSLTGSNLNNLIEDTAANACNLIHGSNGNIIGQDPQLDPLFGSPAYYPLQLGSPARDAGDPGTCSSPPVNNQSQNGIRRPQDGDGNGVPVCDIGSFEGPTLQADMWALGGTVPAVLAPGGSYSLSFSCWNLGPAPASQATCGVSVSAGSVSGVSCMPSVPTTSPLPPGGIIDCTFTYTAPGTPGGSDTAPTGAVFTFTAGSVTSDPIPGNNTATSGATPIPLVDAVDDAASYPAGTAGATFNVGANDQYGSGSLPSGSPSPSFSLVSGSTTCTGPSINATTGVATFNVPASGTCVVVYQVCVSGACDNAQLLVTPTYTITVSVNPSGGGSITCSPNPVPHGSGSTCTINANAGYSLQSVTGCGGTLSGSTYTIASVTGACTVNVTFQQQQVEAIPTLEEWGLLTLITLLAASGVVLVRRLWA